MKYKKNILLIILIISSLGLILLPKSVKGSIADIHYNFENDILYNSNSFNSSSSFNLRNITEYTQTYNSSYSFTNETEGTSGIDINFIDFTDLTSNSFIQINDSQYNHDKVIEFHDESANTDSGYHIFDSDRTIDTIEFWWLTDDNTKRMDVYIGDGATIGIYLAWSNVDFYYNDGGFNIVDQGNSNTWYHHRLDFDTTTDTFDWYINGILYADLGFANALTKVNRFTVFYHTVFTDYSHFFDGIGYSWLDNYTISQNIFPIIETNTELKEVDKFEFAFDGVNHLYSFGDSNADTWTDIEIGGGNQATIVPGSEVNDNLYLFIAGAGGDFRGIEKDFNINGQFVNITTKILFADLDGTLNSFSIMIDAKDTTFITALTFDSDGDLRYWDGGSHVLRNDITVFVNYTVNIFLNYEIDRVFLILSINGVVDALYNYPMITTGKQGIRVIEIYTQSTDANTISAFVDYVGVYIDGRSLSAQTTIYGFQTIDLKSLKAWSFRDNNLFTISANGFIHLGGVQGNYLAEESMRNIRTNQNYNNISYFFNLYDSYISDIPDPTIVATIQGNDFFINEISIEGSKLVQESNEYFLEYEHSGIETETSYFYVDNDNKLQFTLITNDTNTEYIQATFDISKVDSTDRAVSFRGLKINKAYGYFYVDYLVGASQIEIPIIEKTTRAILPPNNTIDNFIILISDNDVDTVLGITTGYVSQPILLNVLGIGLPIITAGLIEMMIPLLLIIVPTLLISKGFGKEGKKLIIPLFLIFSLIATATFIIPVWIFFIIVFGTALFLFRNKEIESDI